MSNKMWIILSNTNPTKNGWDVPFVDIFILLPFLIHRFDCEDNILVQNKLTSGYHHGRGNTKPTSK